jgi:Na+-driven multidrug efflux pump
MSIGIFMLGAGMSLSAYFASIGKYWPAVVSSFLGALVTLIGCEFFMQTWGVIAAALVSSISYTVVSIYFLGCFLKKEKLAIHHVLPGRIDLMLYYHWLKRGLYKWKNR